MALCAGIAWAGGDWSAARSKAEEFKRKQEELTRRFPGEVRKVVAAVCSASDAERKDAASRASREARSAIHDKTSELERLERDATEMLDRVASDDALKDKRSEARSLRDEIKSRWDRVRELTRDVENERMPVIEFMLRGGESARRSRLDRCHAKDVAIGFDRAACLMADGETCKIIELAADSSQAISKSRDRARSLKSRLEDELKKPSSDVMKQLIDRNREFGRCKRVEVRVDCYKQCPEIRDDGRFSESSASWRESC